jgi:hypothetical protein
MGRLPSSYSRAPASVSDQGKTKDLSWFFFAQTRRIGYFCGNVRPKIVIPILLMAVAISGGVWFFGEKSPAPTADEAPAGFMTNTFISAPAKTISRPAPAESSPAIALVKPEPSEAEIEAKAEFLQNRISELDDLAMSDDPDSLRQILGELDNPEPQIRAAAVDAAVQFKSAAAIPALQDAETEASDLDEKVHIQKAIDFLNLANPAVETNSNP